MGEEDLYRDIILDHFKNPRNKGAVADPDIKVTGANPFCGDEIEITLKIQNNRAETLGINAQGCAISQASTSMMSEALQGKQLNEIKDAIAFFRDQMLSQQTKDWPPQMEDLESLEGVKQYPVRVKCALLAWNTLAEGIKEFQAQGNQKVAARHVEGEQ
ncbi:MAG: SUF system NifU family Fe-S cluster assembly protein [Elusimicrobia bacterium]|nr:SUF system NifU family Fe-S cluster assembly protein [Elusimicrobiota bacterium]